jgi:HEAT repeat protein
MDPRERYAGWSDEALFAQAVETVERDEYYDCVAALHLRGTKEIYDLAVAHCHSADGIARRVGAVVLAQLGCLDDYPFHEASKPLLVQLLSDSDPDALVGAAHSFGFIDCPDAIPDLVRLAAHPDPDVRDSVVWGLGGQVSPEFPPAAVSALITLSADSADRDIRDWATFFLRSVAEADIDTPEIRAAMWARMEDEDAEVRAEALEGLAVYGDRATIPPLAAEIRKGCEQDWAYQNVLRAAEALADAALLPALQELRECVSGWLADDDREGLSWLDDIDRAVAARSGGAPEPEGAKA